MTRPSFCCSREHHAQGLCRGHYDRWRRTGEIDQERPLEGPDSRLEMCGCHSPALNALSPVCGVCELPNLAALLERHPASGFPPIVEAAVAGGRVRIL